MDWQIAAAVGELLGAGGVIASLVYLAGQVRNNAAHTRQAAAQSIISGFNDALADLADPTNAEFFFGGLLNGLKSYSSYTDAAAFSARMFTITRHYEELYHYRLAGAIDDWVWLGLNRMMSDILSNPGAVEWWHVRSDWFSDEFRQMVDESTAESPHRLASDYASRIGVTWADQSEASDEPLAK